MSAEKKSDRLKVTVYSPESGMLAPGKLISDTFVGLGQSWELGWRFFRRNFSSQFRQSLLGLFWAFIPPIMTTAVWVFLNGQRIINIDDPGVPYPAFVLTSTLLWSVFASSLLMPISSIRSGRSIMVKINFPKESLLISGLCQIGFDFLIKSILIVVVFAVFAVQPSLTIPLALFGVLALVLLGISLGLLLLPVGMLYSDVQRLFSAILPFWMLLTPVIYPLPREGIAQTLNYYNPVSPLLTTTRAWLFGNNPEELKYFFIITGSVIFMTFMGLLLFRLTMPIIIERIGS